MLRPGSRHRRSWSDPVAWDPTTRNEHAAENKIGCPRHVRTITGAWGLTAPMLRYRWICRDVNRRNAAVRCYTRSCSLSPALYSSLSCVSCGVVQQRRMPNISDESKSRSFYRFPGWTSRTCRLPPPPRVEDEVFALLPPTLRSLSMCYCPHKSFLVTWSPGYRKSTSTWSWTSRRCWGSCVAAGHRRWCTARGSTICCGIPRSRRRRFR